MMSCVRTHYLASAAAGQQPRCWHAIGPGHTLHSLTCKSGLLDWRMPEAIPSNMGAMSTGFRRTRPQADGEARNARVNLHPDAVELPGHNTADAVHLQKTKQHSHATIGAIIGF